MTKGRASEFRFVATPQDDGRRFDQVLAAHVPDLSRRRARVLIDLGGVFVDGTRAKMSGRAVKAGQKIVAHIGGALARATKTVGASGRARDESALPAYEVVFEDDEIVVVAKPAGLLTAPTPESDRNNLVSLLSRRAHPGADAASPASPARSTVLVVHRLDLDTSGLLVFARTSDANRFLSARFRLHDVEREYLAVVRGAFPDRIAVLDQPIAGRRALTHVKVAERLGSRATLIRARLETGRTHQVRIHLCNAGYPVLGDRTYGARTDLDPPRMALHATLLAFEHPRSHEKLSFERPWPVDLEPWLSRLRPAPA